MTAWLRSCAGYGLGAVRSAAASAGSTILEKSGIGEYVNNLITEGFIECVHGVLCSFMSMACCAVLCAWRAVQFCVRMLCRAVLCDYGVLCSFGRVGSEVDQTRFDSYWPQRLV